MRLLDSSRMIEDSLSHYTSSDAIHFDKLKGTEWLNGIFERHINNIESDLVETGQFTFGQPPITSFFSVRPVTNRLGAESCF